MQAVEIQSHQGALILRARNSELLIIPQHIIEMKKLKDPKEFSSYFIQAALVNRPARKLFEAWLRKDSTVWPRLFKQVQSCEIPEEILKEIEAHEQQNKNELASKEAETSASAKKSTKKTASSTVKKETSTKKSTSKKKVTKKVEKSGEAKPSKATKKTTKKKAK